ncbi:cellulose biosynthesis cyclic di-GMP-binding regulatory protein BcsB [Devosia chinhatensis]|uniref:Cyclic di-GMP-binding protein n=1 Tax=Devosia chinhatensis TaxID=429727 RepID=A0A0F5FEZ7_9HYPH|nr:cellulose biosynthesis cyclic di-GMP-binding regulatory protein BcsB [Devosia chinhatensis]KKB07373.1 hypothetical protein VE26_11370 [Devosia chinhatensis]
MNKRASLSLLFLAGLMASAHAQPAPFDMTPESDLRIPTPEPAPAPSPVPTPAIVAAPSQPFSRYINDSSAIRLEGEESRESVIVYLTEAQAAAPARFEFSFLNSLVVAPEYSSLRVRFNNTEISSSPLAASSEPASRSIQVPAGILKAGPNVIEFRATERHRTDCSIDSTYELWTQIESNAVRLLFEGDNLSRLSRLSDLPAIGVDADGETHIRLISAPLTNPETAEAAVKLAQYLALAMRVPELVLEEAETLSEGFQSGTLDVILLPADDLPAGLDAMRGQASAGPIAVLTTLASGASTLVISGPDWASITRASEALHPGETALASVPRIDLVYPHPVMLGSQTVSLAALGTETAEFNGRRLTADFQFELPADFYANRYGALDLVLDAAYSSDILPNSEIDIYTNGQIASATPLLRTDGGQLRDTVIRIPMTSLRPGRNEGVIAINLQSASDAVCSPGWTGQAPVRFVLSNSSQLRFPDYARVAQVPDLQVLAGSGWPYADAQSVPLVVGGSADSVLSAMMFVARITAASGRILPLDIVPATELTPDRDGLVIMPLGEMPPPISTRTGIATAMTASDTSALDRFSGERQDVPFAEQVDAVLGYFGLQRSDLRLFAGPEPLFEVSANTTVLSQMRQGEGGIWTILTANDARSLRSGTEQLIITQRWREIGGRISAISSGGDALTVVPASQVMLAETQPFSFANARLIAANWFSGNIVYFTLAIIAAAVLLTLASSAVLSQLGRRQ